MRFNSAFKGLKTQLNPICHLLALLGAHHILHVSRIRVNEPTGTPKTCPYAVHLNYIFPYLWACLQGYQSTHGHIPPTVYTNKSRRTYNQGVRFVARWSVSVNTQCPLTTISLQHVLWQNCVQLLRIRVNTTNLTSSGHNTTHTQIQGSRNPHILDTFWISCFLSKRLFLLSNI